MGAPKGNIASPAIPQTASIDTQAVRPKKWILHSGKHDCNQIQRIQTTGLGVLHMFTVSYKIKDKNRNLTLLESSSGMSMNDTKNAEMGIRIFIYDHNTFILYVTDYVTITYDYILLYSYNK